MSNNPTPYLTLTPAMHILNLVHPQLTIDQLTTDTNQSCCFYGENGSGIETFMQLLEGRLKNYSATIFELDTSSGILSFRAQQEILEEEIRNDNTDFMDRIDPGTTAAAFIGTPEKAQDLLTAFNMTQCLDTGFRQLSSGQCRKLIMLREVIQGTRTMILQNPYDGLDVGSCTELNQALEQLTKQGIAIIVLVNSKNDIPHWCSTLGIFKGLRLAHWGAKKDTLVFLEQTQQSQHSDETPFTKNNASQTESLMPTKHELIFLHNGFAGYGKNTLFTGLNLEVYSGDHTLIYGPNGCGKSTLLDIITGDNPKCYANDLRMFGNKRGGGESIWELKQKIGIISHSLHQAHRIPGTALHVVLSGLFDSIGLYDKVSTVQIKQGKHWLEWFGLTELIDKPFRQLEFSEQRLILIARALIKKPRLLIFDEATQGLDDKNRFKLLSLLDLIAEQELSTILFVSHRIDEYRPFFKQKIQLDAYNV